MGVKECQTNGKAMELEQVVPTYEDVSPVTSYDENRSPKSKRRKRRDVDDDKTRAYSFEGNKNG